MRRLTLGRTGLDVPAVSVGTWGHGGPQRSERHAVGWSGLDDDAARDALRAAWRAGLDHWDTADAYGSGHSERLIGSLWSEIPRREIVLASKVGWERGPVHGYEPRQMRAQIEGSLARLRTDSIDIFYLHHCDFGADDRYLEGAIELVREFRDAGAIRWVGLSDWDNGKVARYAPIVEPDVVQVYRSVLADDYRSSGLQAWVRDHRAGVCFFSPLQHGLLLGRYRRPTEFEAGDHRSRRPEFRDQRLLDHLRECRAAVEARFPTLPQPLLSALISAVVADEPGACALLGMRTPDHVAAAAEIDTELDAAEVAWVRDLYRSLS